MFLTHDMADAFGDWLECRRIQRALVAAMPGLAEAITADGERPLLRIRRPGRGTLIVAKASDENAGRWIIGVPSGPSPILHDADSWEAAVDIVLSAVGEPGADAASDGTGDADE